MAMNPGEGRWCERQEMAVSPRERSFRLEDWVSAGGARKAMPTTRVGRMCERMQMGRDSDPFETLFSNIFCFACFHIF